MSSKSSASSPSSALFRFTAPRVEFGVDARTGTLTNLQLMVAGREAKGHGIYIDDQTLATALEAVKQRGGRLKGYITHNHAGACSSGPSWMEAPSMDEAASELNIPGFFSALAVKSAQLIAGQFEFYEAFKKNFAPQFEQLLEMAKKTPDLIGLSVECWGYLVFVAKDGTEYSAEPEDVELRYDGMPALRVTDLWAAAFVGDGAATDGLYAAFSRKLAGVFGGKQSPAQRQEIAKALLEFAVQFAAEGKSAAELPPAPRTEGDVPALIAPPLATPPSTDSSTMKIIADLKAKITDPKRFAAAMSIVGNTPADKLASLTVGEVEQQLAALDVTSQIATLTTERDDFKAQLATRTTELATANGTIATLTTDRDSWKTKFETLKASGKSGSVDLGATTGGVAADTPNPWLKASFNRTIQAEITKKDPERAQALKAAAAAGKS